MGVLGVDLDKTNLDDDQNFYEDIPYITIHVRLLTWRNIFEIHKALKKDTNGKLMPRVCHPTRCRDWRLSKDEM